MLSSVSNKELAAIKAIQGFVLRNNKMPSVRELMRELGYKSPRSASVILEGLLEKEIIKKKNDGSIQLVAAEFEQSELNREQTLKIPLLGTIACGTPIFAEENIEAFFPVSVKLAKQPGKYFLLRAEGDSMNKAGITDGDLLLVRQQNTANNGEIVVALIDDEATVKRLKINEFNVVLVPESDNKSHMPIILSRDFLIQGVLISVIPGI